MPRPHLACRRESDTPFLTQLAQGNTREHLDEGDESGLINTWFPTRTSRVHCTRWGRKGCFALLEFQPEERRSREPSNATVNRGRDRSYLLHSAQDSVTFLRFGLGIGTPW